MIGVLLEDYFVCREYRCRQCRLLQESKNIGNSWSSRVCRSQRRCISRAVRSLSGLQ